MTELKVLPDAESVALKAVEIFLEVRPRAVVLPGGETPLRTYELLRKEEIDWAGTDVFLSDERWLPQTHPMSNWNVIHSSLLKHVSAEAHRIRTELAPEKAAEMYEKEVKSAIPFDLAFLGIGIDGHTASIFTGMSDRELREKLVVVSWSKGSGLWRVTLSLKALDQAKRVVFLVTGEEKADVLWRLMRGDNIPAAWVKGQGDVLVLADEKAAARVGKTTA